MHDERSATTWVAAAVDGILARHPAVGLAVGIVRDGHPDAFWTRGLAGIESRTPVTEDTVFRIGSLTKTFTAVAVLQLVEQGRIDLDAPAATYLRSFRLVPAEPGWPPPTVRQLLTHTSGVGEVREPADLLRPVFGEMVRPGRRVPSLAEYYRRGLPLRAAPGTRWRYTGHGFAVLGRIVEDLTGEPLGRALRERVFAPLGMADTELGDGRLRVATGHTFGRHGPRPVRNPRQVTAAAGAACSTPRDMARYARALLGGGANEHGRVLQPATVATMFAPQYRPDPRIPGMGLAFFRGETAGHPVVEHGGVVPGFDAQAFLAPEDGVAVLAFTNGTRGGMFWLPGETAGLLAAVLGVPTEAIRTDLPHSPEIWGELCGRYWLRGPLTDARARAMTGAGVQVLVRGGRPVLRVLTPVPGALRGLELHPDEPGDPFVFRIDLTRYGIGTVRVVFSRAPGSGVREVHVDRGQFLTARTAPRPRGVRRAAAAPGPGA
jgi:CubicO group peptidase (beta-lactamase class C family)